MRLDIKEVLHLKKINNESINYAKIAKQYDCDYRTVKKYYNERDDNLPLRKPRDVAKVTDGFEEIIKEKYLIDKAPAISIYNLLKDKYGYKGSYTTIKTFTHKLKTQRQEEVTVRYETSPGFQGQIDWKEELTLTSRLGEVFLVNIFLAILGYSRYKYIELTLDKSQPTVFRCLTNTIKYFGGVPKEFLFDNMKTVVDRAKTQYDKVVFNEKFYQFSKDAGFKPRACMPYRPKTKGKVETLARIMNRLKAYNNEFDTLEELEIIVRQLNIDINNEISKTTYEKPIDRLNKEKEYLSPLPRLDILETYYTNPTLVRKVPKDCLITYKNHKYSVPPTYVGKSVTIEINNNNLYIYYDKTIIASHQITDKLITYDKSHYKELMKYSLINQKDIERMCEENLKLFDNL